MRRRLIVVTLAGVLFAAGTSAATAAPADLDATFGSGGVAEVHAGPSANQSSASAVAVDPNGDVVVAGESQPPSSGTPTSTLLAVGRFTPQGSPDSTFGTGGQVTADLGGLVSPVRVRVQSDGKPVVLALVINLTSGAIQSSVMRFTAAGAPDDTFGTQGKVTVQPTASEVAAIGLALDPAGNVAVAGTTVSGTSATPFVERLTTFGTPDPTFGTAGIADLPGAGASSVVALSDGSLVIGGAGTKTGTELATWKVTPSGTIDTAYGNGGMATAIMPAPFGVAVDIAADPNGNVDALGLLGGTPLVARFGPGGALDTTFGNGGKATVDLLGGLAFSQTLAVTADGSVVIGGPAEPGMFVARLTPQGLPDRTFAADGKATATEFSSTLVAFATGGPVLTSDGKPILPGAAFHPLSSSAADMAAIRFQGGATSAIPAANQAVRHAGGDRIATAVATSQATFSDVPCNDCPEATRVPAGAVVLASADSFADALVGTPLAARNSAPLLLTHQASLDAATANEIGRVLGPGSNHASMDVLGGPAAVSTAISQQLSAAGYTVSRLAGNDRYQTAVAVANAINPLVALEANGQDFPDGVSAGAAAAHVLGAVLLTAGSTQAAATATYLQGSSAPAVRYAIGGPAAAADHTATAITGTDRYDTSVKVASTFFGTPSAVGLATGAAYPDALSGGARQAELGGPVLLTNSTVLSPTVAAYLHQLAPWIDTVDVYGGTGAVTAGVAGAAQSAIT